MRKPLITAIVMLISITCIVRKTSAQSEDEIKSARSVFDAAKIICDMTPSMSESNVDIYFDLALNNLESAIFYFPFNAPVYSLRAKIYYEKGDSVKGLAHEKRAKALIQEYGTAKWKPLVIDIKNYCHSKNLRDDAKRILSSLDVYL